MGEPYHQMYVHLIWATWDRLPLLTPGRRDMAYRCIQAECGVMKAEVLAIGGIEDHVHLLLRYKPSLDVPLLVKQAKGASSHLITHKSADETFFKWQGYYISLSLSKAEMPRVKAYILQQIEHHRDNTTLPEYEGEDTEA